MAKLKGPLMSLGASGKLADTLVFFPWKGLNVVREYVIPANPDTTLQGVQRDHLKAAVVLVHAAMAHAIHPLTSADQIAYSALAAAKGRIITWFNQAVKLYLDTILTKIGDSEVPCVYSGGTMLSPAHDTAAMIVYLNEETPDTLTVGKFYLGTSKTNLIHSKVGVVDSGVSIDNGADRFDDLIAGKKYYWQFRPDVAAPCEGADSGIYHFVAT